jgi:hypothetical protein
MAFNQTLRFFAWRYGLDCPEIGPDGELRIAGACKYRKYASRQNYIVRPVPDHFEAHQYDPFAKTWKVFNFTGEISEVNDEAIRIVGLKRKWTARRENLAELNRRRHEEAKRVEEKQWQEMMPKTRKRLQEKIADLGACCRLGILSDAVKRFLVHLESIDPASLNR